MASTNFTPGTTITSIWLNDVDEMTYVTAPGHIADAVGAHTASAIANTPAGSIPSTDVQAALNNLDTRLVSVTNQAMTTGFWTPTVTGLTNVSGTMASEGMYSKFGGVVTCSNYFLVTPTVSGTFTEVLITIPIASAFILATDAVGTMAIIDGAHQGDGMIQADFATDSLRLRFMSVSTAQVGYTFICQYRLR